jgi:hypothetical protein
VLQQVGCPSLCSDLAYQVTPFLKSLPKALLVPQIAGKAKSHPDNGNRRHGYRSPTLQPVPPLRDGLGNPFCCWLIKIRNATTLFRKFASTASENLSTRLTNQKPPATFSSGHLVSSTTGGGGKAAFRRNALTPRILHILVRDFITRSHFRGQIYGVYHFRYIEPRICAPDAYR